ncbi:hypothetical protein CASFOL_016259 [Castilleja foliolosa]|uniref:F-box domain-containing protein n=1 Tax=Castilleja foliolosa TaxID=1961234 RepID=A0ABD3DK40_9LAMI
MNRSRQHVSYPEWIDLSDSEPEVSAIPREAEINHNGKDMISQLSDDILISIVGRLRTKEAVRTSILSSRWRNIYKFTPNVDLNSERLVGTAPCSQIRLVAAVKRFLRLCSVSHIRSLDLTCYLCKSY